MRRCKALYAKAEVEDAVDSFRRWRGARTVELLWERIARVGSAKRAFRVAIVAIEKPIKASIIFWRCPSVVC
jgi:hypothetical protein